MIHTTARFKLFCLLATGIFLLACSPMVLFLPKGAAEGFLLVPVLCGALPLGLVGGAALGGILGCSLYLNEVFFSLAISGSLPSGFLSLVLGHACAPLAALLVHRLLVRLPRLKDSIRPPLMLAGAAGIVTNLLVEAALGPPVGFAARPNSFFFSACLGILVIAPCLALAVPALQKLLEDKQREESIGRLFRLRIILVMLFTFLIFMDISLFAKTHTEMRSADHLLELEINYMRGGVQDNSQKRKEIKALIEQNIVDRCRSLVLFLRKNPSAAHDQALLARIVSSLRLDEASIVDATGLIIASVPPQYAHQFNFSSNKATAKYMRLITDPSAVIVEELRQNLSSLRPDSGLWLYAGVPRQDAPGFVQAGINIEQYAAVMRTVSIENIAREYNIRDSGYALLSRDGVIVSARDMGDAGSKTLDLGIPAKALGGGAGRFLAVVKGERTLGHYAAAEGYALVTLLPEKEIFEERDQMIARSFVLFCILFISQYLLISHFLERLVVQSMRRINDVLSHIARGDFKRKVNVRTSREFAELSKDINTMVDELREHLAKEAERIEWELRLARTIQSASMHRLFPPYPDHREFDIYATINTAKEVGGDFFDFFLVDDGKLAFVIADVSGKGIPAALFMMRVQSQIKSHLLMNMPLADTVNLINEELCAGNDAGMFVTAFIAELDLRTGHMTYVNAGHNLPLLRREGGVFHPLGDGQEANLVLGVMEGLPYCEYSLLLGPGDRLFCYTDGVTDAIDAQERPFGMERLRASLDAHATEPLEALLPALTADVADFVGAAAQFDDITMLAVDYFGVQKREITAR